MWQRDKKSCAMMQLSSTIEEFVEEVCKQAKFLCEHHYIKNKKKIMPLSLKKRDHDFFVKYTSSIIQVCIKILI